MNLEDKILFALEQVAQASQLLTERESRAMSLSALQLRILQAVANHPLRQGVGSLARRLGLTPATVSDAVRVLQEKGLLRKTRSSEDARAYHLTLTRRGEKTVRSGGKVGNALREKIALLPEDEQKTFLQSLVKLISSLLSGGLIPVDRMCLDCHFFRPNFFPDTKAPHLCAFVGARFEETAKTSCLGSCSGENEKIGRLA